MKKDKKPPERYKIPPTAIFAAILFGILLILIIILEFIPSEVYDKF